MDTVQPQLTRPIPTLCQRVLASGLVSAQRMNTVLDQVGDHPQAVLDELVRQGALTNFQARQLRAGATGFNVDKYIVLDCLGRGGSGIVLKARTAAPPERLVALKTLDPRTLHGDREALVRFRREIAAVTRLQHANVVRAYEVVRTRVQVYLVLEYVDGHDLATEVQQRGPLPVDEAVSLALQALRGLSYAHRCGVIHRDLKPSNLLLTREGMVKISDLGLARMEDEAEDACLTIKGSCLGTPEFMAPEQAEDATAVDARCDLYSLGATLFHLLTAELPVHGSTWMQRLHNLLLLPPRALGEVRADLPRGLAEVVDRLRSPRPDDRPKSAEEVISLLAPYSNKSEPTTQTWDGRGRAAIVLEVLQGRLSPTAACARYRLSPADLDQWRRCFLEGAARALESPESAASRETLLS